MTPTIADVVDQRSMCDIISSYTTPCGMWFGHHMMPGTRQPASNAEPFSPRNGCVPASGYASCHAPLSAVKITIVFGATCRIASMIRPTLSSISMTESEYRPSFDLPANLGAGLFGLCIFMKLTSMKKGLLSLACCLMYSMAESACRTSNVAR